MESKAETVGNRILNRISRAKKGTIFTASDFLDIGSRQAIDVALHRLTRRKALRRVTRGLYERPQKHAELGTLSPNIANVARALAGKGQLRLLPSGAYATNLLGLSEQVPAKAVFLTDGPSRTLKIGRQEIHLRHTTPRNLAAAERLTGLLVQAFRHLGREHITAKRIAHLKRTLPANERRRLLKDLPLAPSWMHSLFRDLAES